jgi:hypothetical protein
MSLLLLDGTQASDHLVARPGLVRSDRKVVYDDLGVFHPWGVTFFWGPYGWKYERDRVLAHFEWLQTRRPDYLRVLCEVDWTGRSIDPAWPDYVPILQEFVDVAYDFSMRCELTIVGGRQYDKHDGHQRFVPTDLARTVATAMQGREHKVMHYEMANEFDRLDKVTMTELIAMGEVVVPIAPNLVALSRPKSSSATTTVRGRRAQRVLAEDKSESDSGYGAMRDATAAAGANAFTLHPRRSDTDFGWSHVRQGYDFKDFPGATWNNEPEGPQSSGESMDNPLQLACCRLLGIVCGGAGYVLHVGQGVTGEADPEHDRPENMWEVPNIDYIMDVVGGVDVLAPPGVENWKCVNNARDDHPLPLDGTAGFWEGSEGRAPAVNKNYAALSGDGRFVVIPIGVRSVEEIGPVPMTQGALRACHVEAYDPELAHLGKDHARVAEANLEAGQPWSLPGRHDTMAAYLIEGVYR